MNTRPVLTTRQAEILIAFENFVAARGWPPSITELCKEVNLARGPAQRHLEALERKGVLLREEGAARAITILVPSGDVRVVDLMPMKKAHYCERCSCERCSRKRAMGGDR